jgi:hypothetical protein
MWKWINYHKRLMHYDPRGFLNFGEEVGKVILFTKLTWKLHLPLFFISLTNVIIRFIIIIVVLAFVIVIIITILAIIIMIFLLVPSRLSVTFLVYRMHGKYIHRLGG